MATSQDIVSCEICMKEPLQHFCNGCEIRLCKNCVLTHLDSGSVEGHTIVQYKYRDARNIQPRVCLDHPAMLKTLYCRECLAQICAKCCDEHKGHELIDLKQFVNSQFMEIEKSSEYLRSKLLPNGTECIEKMKLLLEEVDTKYDQERQRILDAGKDLHRKVDEGADVLLGEIEKQKKETSDQLQDMIRSAEARLQDINDAIDMCEAAKSSLDDVLKFTFDESSLDIRHTVEVTFPHFEAPAKFTVDIGSLKSVRKEKGILEESFGKNKQSVEGAKHEEETKKKGGLQDRVLFIENPHLKAIEDLLRNCKKYKEEFQLDKELDEASNEYQDLLKRAKRPGFKKTTPPYELNLFNDERRCQAPSLYDVISIVSKKCPHTHWKKAVSEFIGLTPIQTKPMQPKEQEEDKEEEVFHDAMDGRTKDKAEKVDVRFKVFPYQQPIATFLQNCKCFKEELQLGEELDEAVNEYDRLLKKAKETGCPALRNAPPSQLNAVSPGARCQAPCLYEVISDVSKRCPKAKWMDAVTELITLTTYSQSVPKHAEHQRPRSASGYQKKKEKVYRNAIEKLLDQEWDSDFIPKTAVEYDYRHFYTSESALRSSFPDAYIFNMASSTLSKPEDVPPEFRERTLFNFLLSIDMKKYGVNPEDAWREFGRCVLAEKQLDLARRAVGPDLDKNVIVDKKTFYKIQNELQEKTQEIEELSTRLNKSEGNPNVADLSDTSRPTRLGEMYSQLFDDEWSEAFEAFKPKKGEEEGEEDDDMFPDTLFILQNILKEIFEFCKTQSQKQLVQLEDNFATVIGLKKPKLKKPNEEKKENKQTDSENNPSEQPKVSDENGEETEIEEEEEDKKYRTDPAFPMIEHHAREFRKSAAATSARTKSKLFINVALPNLVMDESIREDLRTLTYVRKCVELCWYMCMQDPPMVIISPEKGQDIDKDLFSLHGRRGKTMEVCVWPALLLHDNGPLVCKGYVLPEERKRKK